MKELRNIKKLQIASFSSCCDTSCCGPDESCCQGSDSIITISVDLKK